MKKLIILILLGCSTIAQAAAPYDKLIIFGDSLSDNGNLYAMMDGQYPPSPPYYQGHFSNGPVWAELLNAYFFPSDDHLLDYALGGAGLDIDDDDMKLSLTKEVDSYLEEHGKDDKRYSIFMVWIGANNYFGAPENYDEVTTKVVARISANIERLIDSGAKEILLINLPDIGKTPFAREAEKQQELTAITEAHNAKLYKNFLQLKQQHPEVKWRFYDFNKLFQKILANPSEYGFSNVTDECLQDDEGFAATMPSLLQANPVTRITINNKALMETQCQGYLFWDSVHPMEVAHQIISSQLNDKLS